MAKYSVERVQKMVEDSNSKSQDVACRWHGITDDNVIDHLVTPPYSARFTKDRGVGFLWLWVVFDEDHEREDAYLVVFDPRQDRYGLATKARGSKCGSFIGFYGSTIGEAIGSM